VIGRRSSTGPDDFRPRFRSRGRDDARSAGRHSPGNAVI
jgi:hypothetical protein